MKSLLLMVLSVGLGFVVLASACAPKSQPSTPVTQQTPTPTTAPTGPSPVAVATPSAWDRVVAEAKKEGKITPYTFAMTGDIGRAVARAFEDRYGIKVEFVGGVGAVLIERIKSEQAGKKFIADTIDTSTVLVAIAKGEGITISTGALPNFQEKEVFVGPPSQDPEGHLIGIDTLLQGLYYNTTLVKPGEEPKSYKDLLEPRWKGRFVIMDPNTVPLLPRLYSVMKANRILDDDYFVRLGKQEPRLAPTVRDGDAQVARGESPLGFNASTTINPFIKEGAPAKPIDVAEGVILAISPSIAMVKGGPHPNATRVFINWLISKEGQTVYQQARGSQSVRKDVPDFTPPAARLKPSKVVLATLALELEAARLQRERVITKLMGLMQ